MSLLGWLEVRIVRAILKPQLNQFHKPLFLPPYLTFCSVLISLYFKMSNFNLTGTAVIIGSGKILVPPEDFMNSH